MLKWRLQLPSFHVLYHTSHISPQPRRCCLFCTESRASLLVHDGPSSSALCTTRCKANVNEYSRSESSKLLMHWDDRGLYEAWSKSQRDYSSGWRWEYTAENFLVCQVVLRWLKNGQVKTLCRWEIFQFRTWIHDVSSTRLTFLCTSPSSRTRHQRVSTCTVHPTCTALESKTMGTLQ